MNNYVDNAVEHFKKLLLAQIERAENMNDKKEKTTLEKIKIGFVDGDGIGPIIVKVAKKVLSLLLEDKIKEKKVELVDINGLTIENRLKLSQSVPEDILKKIKECDVLLKGPTETPKGGTMESANVTLRRELDLFSNVRPVSLKEKNIDWTFFRENTEGEYVLGSSGIDIPNVLAFDFKVITNKGTERIAKAAFEFAKNNGKDHVCIVTKANIMKKTDGKFSEICHEVAKDYPNITVEDYYIDIMCANLLNEDIRSKFKVFILPNLYGDIITDEAAQIQGGVGTAGSANIGSKYAMFEAVHGSAPRLIEAGLGEYASPESILRAAVMMLAHIGFIDEKEKLEKALNEVSSKLVCNGTKDGVTSSEFGDAVINVLKR